MSQENVEIVTRAIDAFNRREIDAFVEFGTPDFEWFPSTVRDGRGRQSLLDGVHAISEPKRVHHSIDLYPMQNRASAGFSAEHPKQATHRRSAQDRERIAHIAASITDPRLPSRQPDPRRLSRPSRAGYWSGDVRGVRVPRPGRAYARGV
jgi:ketosteroid isomerase-like protein